MCGKNTVELTGFAEALRWSCSFVPRVARVRFFYDSKRSVICGQVQLLEYGSA